MVHDADTKRDKGTYGKGQTVQDLTPAQVAERLGIHPQTVIKLLQAGELRAYKIGSGPKARWRITVEAVEAFRQPHNGHTRDAS